MRYYVGHTVMGYLEYDGHTVTRLMAVTTLNYNVFSQQDDPVKSQMFSFMTSSTTQQDIATLDTKVRSIT